MVKKVVENDLVLNSTVRIKMIERIKFFIFYFTVDKII